MSFGKITRAFLIVTEETGVDVFRKKIGGETVFGRALIALSRAGITRTDILVPAGVVESARKASGKIRRRLKTEIRFYEKQSGDDLGKFINPENTVHEEPVLILECSALIHPTLIQPLLAVHPSKPAVPVFRQVWLEKGTVRYSAAMPERYKVQFRHPEHFLLLPVPEEDQRHLIEKGFTESPEVSALVSAGDHPYGFFTVPAVICPAGHRMNLSGARNLTDALFIQTKEKNLQTFWIDPAWYLPLKPGTTEKDMNDFLWKMAFKEISGEFSKAVNSHLSKPLTFLLARWGFTPNAVSVIEIILFFVSSAFLLIPGYWPMIVFAVIWQLSAGVLDRCDGEVARMRNYESTTGARFDMLIDDLRFGIPLVVLTYACWNESGGLLIYPFALVFIVLWYVPAALIQQYYMRRAGYVSIQALGVELLKSMKQEEIPGWFSRYRFLLKGDIRTFYVFLLSFTGYKPVIFWVLFLYELLVGLTDLITVRKMKRVMRDKLSPSQERV